MRYESAKTRLMRDILWAMSQHKMASTRFSGNPKVNSEVITYVTIFGQMPFLCDFGYEYDLKTGDINLSWNQSLWLYQPTSVCLSVDLWTLCSLCTSLHLCLYLLVCGLRVPAYQCLLEAACLAACEPMNKTCLVCPWLLKISLTSRPPVTVLSWHQSWDLTPPWALGTCALVCSKIWVYLSIL